MIKSKCKKFKREDFEQGIRNFFNMNPYLPVNGCVYDVIYDSGEDTLKLSSNNEQSRGHKDVPIINEEEEEESQRQNSSKSSSPSSLSTVPIESCSASCSIGSASSSNHSCTNTSSDFINTSSSSSLSLLSSENSTSTDKDMLIPSRPSSPYPFSIPSPPVSMFSTTTLDFDLNTDPQDILDPDFLLALNETDFSGNFSDIDSDINDRNNNNNKNDASFNKSTTTTNNNHHHHHHEDIENIHIEPLNTKELVYFNEDSNNSTIGSSVCDFSTSPGPSTSSQSNLKEMENKIQASSNKSDESCTKHHRHLIKSRGRNDKQLQNLYSPETRNRQNRQLENEWREGRRSERLAIRTAKLKSTSSTTIIHNNTNTSSDNGDSNNSNSTPRRRHHFESLQSSRKSTKTKKKRKHFGQNKKSLLIKSQKRRLSKQIINDGKTVMKISKFECLTSDTTMAVHHHESLNRESTELVPFSPSSASSSLLSASSSASSVLSKEFEINDYSSDEEEIVKKIRRRRKKKRRPIIVDTSPIVDTSKITRTLYEGIFPYKTVEKTKNPDFRFTIGPVRQNDNSLVHD